MCIVPALRVVKLSFVLLIAMLFCSPEIRAQRMLTDMMDTTTDIGKGMLSLYEKYNALRFSVYIQPQFQWTDSAGSRNFSGGDFAQHSNNRFTLRRGRFRTDYVRSNADGFPQMQFVFQFDASERGVFVRDCWGRAFENRFHILSLTAGIFARPFGYEVVLGSADRESPERGRMSQLLMRTERDLGAMISLEPRAGKAFRWLRLDAGLFNGPGLPGGVSDYDNHKDFIARAYCKRMEIPGVKWLLSGGASIYQGGIVNQDSTSFFKTEGDGVDISLVKKDSAASNFQRLLPRRYYGADVQLKIPNKKGYTELRAEYIRGQQTGYSATSETPAVYALSGTPPPLYVRRFDGAYFYLLQHLGSLHHQIGIKYDWYDPNTKVNRKNLTSSYGFTAADVRYNTLGGGYIWYATPNVKCTLWYDHLMNEHTALPGFTQDVKDDVLTARVQFRF